MSRLGRAGSRSGRGARSPNPSRFTDRAGSSCGCPGGCRGSSTAVSQQGSDPGAQAVWHPAPRLQQPFPVLRSQRQFLHRGVSVFPLARCRAPWQHGQEPSSPDSGRSGCPRGQGSTHKLPGAAVSSRILFGITPALGISTCCFAGSSTGAGRPQAGTHCIPQASTRLLQPRCSDGEAPRMGHPKSPMLTPPAHGCCVPLTGQVGTVPLPRACPCSLAWLGRQRMPHAAAKGAPQ